MNSPTVSSNSFENIDYSPDSLEGRMRQADSMANKIEKFVEKLARWKSDDAEPSVSANPPDLAEVAPLYSALTGRIEKVSQEDSQLDGFVAAVPTKEPLVNWVFGQLADINDDPESDNIVLDSPSLESSQKRS